MVEIVVEKPSPTPWRNLPKNIIQMNCAPENREYPRAREKQVPKIEVHFRPITLARGPAIRLPNSIPKEAILTEINK